MKNLILTITIVVCILLYTSCNTNDEPIINETIEGSWHFKNIQGGLMGTNINYSRNDIVWTFNSLKKTVSIKNNLLSLDLINTPTGTYDYIIVENGETQILYINYTKKGTLTFTNNLMKIDDNLAADGLLSTFER